MNKFNWTSSKRKAFWLPNLFRCRRRIANIQTSTVTSPMSWSVRLSQVISFSFFLHPDLRCFDVSRSLLWNGAFMDPKLSPIAPQCHTGGRVATSHPVDAVGRAHRTLVQVLDKISHWREWKQKKKQGALRGRGAGVQLYLELKSTTSFCFITINRLFCIRKGTFFKVQTRDALITLSTCTSDAIYFHILELLWVFFPQMLFQKHSSLCFSKAWGVSHTKS